MLRRSLILAAPLVAIFGIWSVTQSSTPIEPLAFGRNNTVLFVTDSSKGLSNVHLATSFALAELYPSLDVHYASFQKMESAVAGASADARLKNPDAKPIIWHGLPPPDAWTSLHKSIGGMTGMLHPPGLKGIDKFAKVTEILLAPWDAEDHWALYQSVTKLIQDVNPAVVVLDSALRPACEAAVDLNRMHVILSPNTLDILVHKQPFGAMLWKYPSMGSGLPFPIPWSLIPTNMYLQLRIMYSVLSAPGHKVKREYLKAKGMKDPLSIVGSWRPDVPWLTMSLPEAAFPLEVVPEGAKYCGPIVLEGAPLEDQDQELAKWLANAPTVLVNLGSLVKYDEKRAHAMADALAIVLGNTDVQILWKMNKRDEFDDSFLEPLKDHIGSGRLRMESWIKADPTSLLRSGHIKLSVHHGGSNCYHEAIFAGVPQVVLPLWFDTYNFAQMVEYLGVGVWPGKDTAPEWDSQSLSEGFLQVLNGNSSESMRAKAEELGEIARQYGGRNTAAQEIAALAVKGHA